MSGAPGLNWIRAESHLLMATSVITNYNRQVSKLLIYLKLCFLVVALARDVAMLQGDDHVAVLQREGHVRLFAIPALLRVDLVTIQFHRCLGKVDMIKC